jgi:hypothetical protein
LFTLQKRALRIIIFSDYDEHSSPLFNKLEILRLPTVHAFSYFRSGGVDKYLGGGVDKYLGGCCCLLWPGRGGNARKGQGKSLTKFVFWACMARSETIILVILQI